MMNSMGRTSTKEGMAATFLAPSSKSSPSRSDGRETNHRKNREFAAWMVGLSFAGDILAIVSGVLLAFSLRFATPLRHLGHAPPAG